MELNDKSLYLNRELSQLEFNYRVLSLAKDETIPLLERLRFLCICNRNLDEFFEIRVAGLKQQFNFGGNITSTDGRNAKETLAEISKFAHKLSKEQYKIFNEQLIPALKQKQIVFLHRKEWTDELVLWLRQYFRTEILPVLTPIGLDLAHPFPRLINKSLNFILSLEGKDAFGRDSGFAVIHAPRPLPRVIRLPETFNPGIKDSFVFLSSIIHAFAEELFPGMDITGCYQFRLTRNSDLFVDEEQVDDLLKALKGKLLARRYGEVVRLEVVKECPKDICTFLLQKFSLTSDELYAVDGPVNLNRVSAIFKMIYRPDLCHKEFIPNNPKINGGSKNIFEFVTAPRHKMAKLPTS